jgi:hypothetical protein
MVCFKVKSIALFPFLFGSVEFDFGTFFIVLSLFRFTTVWICLMQSIGIQVHTDYFGPFLFIYCFVT